MSITKNKECIKYFIMAGVILLCIYSSALSNLLESIYDNIYYGNLVKLFLAITNMIIWGVEIFALVFMAKKFKIQIFTLKEKKKEEMKLWQVIVLFVITILPMLIVSGCINWKVKIVYALGIRVTSVGLACNVAEIVAYAVRMVLIVMFISCIQSGFEKLINSKFIIPYGAIFAFLTFGLIDFLVFSVDLRLFYLLVSFLYGVIYLITGKRFLSTWTLCYLIYLL